MIAPDLPGNYVSGGWLLPIVCTDRGRHPMALLSHAFEDPAIGLSYSADPRFVHVTRQTDAIGVPGASRESLRFTCPARGCRRTPTVDRARWGQLLAHARAEVFVFWDVSYLD